MYYQLLVGCEIEKKNGINERKKIVPDIQETMDNAVNTYVLWE